MLLCPNPHLSSESRLWLPYPGFGIQILYLAPLDGMQHSKQPLKFLLLLIDYYIRTRVASPLHYVWRKRREIVPLLFCGSGGFYLHFSIRKPVFAHRVADEYPIFPSKWFIRFLMGERKRTACVSPPVYLPESQHGGRTPCSRRSSKCPSVGDRTM